MDRDDKLATWVGWSWRGEELGENDSSEEWAGHWHQEGECCDGRAVCVAYRPSYTTSLDACMELVEKAQEKGYSEVRIYRESPHSPWEVNLDRCKDCHADGYEPELPLAICAAIEKLIEREDPS